MLRVLTGIMPVLFIASVSVSSAQQTADRPLEVSPSGTGSAAILPLYTMRDGFDTLVSVYSGATTYSSAVSHAVRLRILDQQGDLQLSANIYLSRHASSAFAMTRAASGDPEVRFSADACVLLPDGPVQPNVPVPLDEDTGYIELFSMGHAGPPLGELVQNCDELQQFWTDGNWADEPAYEMLAPTNALKVAASLINVDRATMYSVDATHLRNFSSVVQHTPPTSETPNLSSAHAPSPDDAALTRSRNCFSEDCVVDDWDTPIEAVRAALTASRLYGEYVTSPSVNGRTEWVLTYPARRYMDGGDDFQVSTYVMPRNDDGLELVCIPEAAPELADVWCRWSFRLNHDWVVNSIDVGYATGHGPGSGTQPQFSPSIILGLDNKTDYPVQLPGTDIPTAGIAVVAFSVDEHNPWRDVALTNPLSGREYRGQPVVGLLLQEYSNGQLTDPDGNPLLARYGNVFDVGRVLLVGD